MAQEPGGKGFPTVPFNYVASANNQRRAEWVQAQMLDVLGVNVSLNPMEGATYQQANSDPVKKLPGLQRLGWCADYPHPADWFGLVFKNGATGNANNVTGFKDAAFDAAVDVADAELSDTKSDELYKAVGLTLIKDAPVVFVDNLEWQFLARTSKVTGLVALPLDGGFPGSTNWEGIDVK